MLLLWIVTVVQKYSLSLVFGVILALVWTNVDEHSYHYATHDPIVDGATMLDHRISLHFLVNDVFMCFTFGLAVKEETEALLQAGRSRRAGAPQAR